jgi:hypothetical protein
MIDPATPLPEDLAIAWARYERWATLCACERCAYTRLHPTDPAPRGRRRDEEQCPGYAATLYMEDGRYVIRAHGCKRKQAWWIKRQAWLREQRKQARERERSVR